MTGPLLGVLGVAAVLSGHPSKTTGAAAVAPTPVSVYGGWLCGNDFCTWAGVRTWPTSTPGTAG